jgi:hypothetical protein
MTTGPMYFTAPFDIQGKLLGIGSRQLSDLAPHWLEFWSQLLKNMVQYLNSTYLWSRSNTSPCSSRLRRAGALVTFAVRGTAASSAVALAGLNHAAESELLGMWVDSMRHMRLVQQAARAGTTPFQSAFALTQRPIYFVVPWPTSQVSDSDRELVQELETHLAAVFLCGTTRPPT